MRQPNFTRNCMKRNEDYINGIKFLLIECKKLGINIHECSWVCDLSMVLSWFNACYKFWHNTFDQSKLHRIPLCKEVKDIMYVRGKSLFTWDMTPEGGDFWNTLLGRDLLGDHLNRKLEDIRLIYGQ